MKLLSCKYNYTTGFIIDPRVRLLNFTVLHRRCRCRFCFGRLGQVFRGHLRRQLGRHRTHRRQFLRERAPDRRDLDSRVLRPVVRTLSKIRARILKSGQSPEGTLRRSHCGSYLFSRP